MPAVYFLWHFPWARALQALPGALSEGARTFLRKPLAYSDCLADSCFLGPRILAQIPSKGRTACESVVLISQLQQPRVEHVPLLAGCTRQNFCHLFTRQLVRKFHEQVIDIDGRRGGHCCAGDDDHELPLADDVAAADSLPEFSERRADDLFVQLGQFTAQARVS